VVVGADEVVEGAVDVLDEVVEALEDVVVVDPDKGTVTLEGIGVVTFIS